MSYKTNPAKIVMLPHPAASLQISAIDGREIVRITHDGQVIVNPEFTIDEAAKAFWDAVKELAEGART